MPVATQLLLFLLLFYYQRVSLGIGIVSDPGDQPADLHARFASRNLETPVLHFFGDVDRSIAAKTGQLVAKVAVEGFEPAGKFDSRLPTGIEHDDAIIDVLHLRRLHEGVGEILAGWIEGMIDLEGSRALGQRPLYIDIANEFAREAAGTLPLHAGATLTTATDADIVLAGADHTLTRLAAAIDANIVGAAAIEADAILTGAIDAGAPRRFDLQDGQGVGSVRDLQERGGVVAAGGIEAVVGLAAGRNADAALADATHPWPATTILAEHPTIAGTGCPSHNATLATRARETDASITRARDTGSALAAAIYTLSRVAGTRDSRCTIRPNPFNGVFPLNCCAKLCRHLFTFFIVILYFESSRTYSLFK